MIPKLKRAGGRLYRLAEHFLVVMIAVMFAAFVLQVVFRYVLNWPTGSTSELSVVLLALARAVRRGLRRARRGGDTLRASLCRGRQTAPAA